MDNGSVEGVIYTFRTIPLKIKFI